MDIILDREDEDIKQQDEAFLDALDRGIEDMKSGREFSLEDAFQKIAELRNKRRNERA